MLLKLGNDLVQFKMLDPVTVWNDASLAVFAAGKKFAKTRGFFHSTSEVCFL